LFKKQNSSSGLN